MKTEKERFPELVSALEKAINDRLKEEADKNGGVYQPSAPILRAAVINGWAEVSEGETEPISGRLAANVIFAAVSINESAYSQKLERLADAGSLSFKIARGTKGKAKGYIGED